MSADGRSRELERAHHDGQGVTERVSGLEGKRLAWKLQSRPRKGLQRGPRKTVDSLSASKATCVNTSKPLKVNRESTFAEIRLM